MEAGRWRICGAVYARKMAVNRMFANAQGLPIRPAAVGLNIVVDRDEGGVIVMAAIRKIRGPTRAEPRQSSPSLSFFAKRIYAFCLRFGNP